MTSEQPVYEIRPATVGDVDGLVELLRQLFEIEQDFVFNEDRHRKALSLLIDQQSNAHVIAAQAGSQVIGMCSIQVLISSAEGGEVGLVEDVVVEQRYRGLGVGNAMLAYLERWSLNRGLSRLQLLADRGNARALSFYRQSGWLDTQLIAVRRYLGVD
jgi:GNAT superfamily N-acetyltransferase